MTLTLAVTPGEPAGIGPDLLIALAQKGHACELVAYADPDLLKQRARILGMPLSLRDPVSQPVQPGELAIAPIAMRAPCTAGSADPRNAPYVIETLSRALEDTLQGHCAALVTGPVNKAVINEGGLPFSGHTEYLAEQTGTPRVVMMLATEGLRVALATTHLPLADVPAAITRPLLEEVVAILNSELHLRFGLTSPRILACGLNPHAGEGGHLGREEIDTITPALDGCRRRGIDITGPLPADTLFTPKYLEQCDAVLAMYHDQGLPVLKYKGFGAAVNITLGLPLIRTSVDHGTALDLAGTGRADTGSLHTAINYALLMATRSRHHG